MNLPNGWQEIGHDWFDGPNRTQVAVRTNIDNTRWYASLRGPERAAKAEAESDASRLAFALEPPPEREGVARALYEAGSKALVALPWVNIPRPVVEAWLSVADTAIRLCGGVREDIEPREPFHVTADRIAKEATDLRAELTRERLATRAAIESRDQVDQEAAALRADVVTLLAKIEDGHREVRCLQRELSGALQLLQEAQNANRELETRLDEARTIAVMGRA